MMKRLGWVLCGALLAFSLGCGGSTTRGDQALPDPTIKFVNASSDSDGLAFFLNDEQKTSSLAYLAATTGFERIPFISDPDGGYDQIVRLANSPEDLDRISNTLSRDNHFILSATGLRNPAGGDEEKRLRLAMMIIDRTPPTGDKAHLYVLHAFSRSPGNETPQITFQTPGDNPQFSLRNIDFASTQDIVVDSGFQQFEARRADADGENIYAAIGTTLKSGGIYFVIIGGVEDNPNVSRRPVIQLIELEPK